MFVLLFVHAYVRTCVDKVVCLCMCVCVCVCVCVCEGELVDIHLPFPQ